MTDLDIEEFTSLFPVDLPGHKFVCWDGPVFLPAVGLIAEIELYDTSTYETNSTEIILVHKDRPDDLVPAVERLRECCKLLRDESTLKKAMKNPLHEFLEFNELVCEESLFSPSPEDDERRRNALEKAFDSFDFIAINMRGIFGLKLPRHMAVFAAFLRSLNELEHRGLEFLGRSPSGIMAWFETNGLFLPPLDGLDPRLHYRYRCDPAEFITIMSGDSDGLHYGLWYDDPAEFPSFIASNYARDSAETGSTGCTTACEVLIDEVNEYIKYQKATAKILALKAALAWFADADSLALKEDGPLPLANAERVEHIGGTCPALPPDSGDPRCSSKESESRYKAYDKRSPEVQEWIKEARAELDQGKPAFALVLGRELHWFDCDDYREISFELLVGAYRKLGRDALAEIAEVHFKNRDLSSVDVY
ncbi:MAG: HPF1 family protein [bacterium]|nr:HPF1 family protein [bacterium]